MARYDFCVQTIMAKQLRVLKWIKNNEFFRDGSDTFNYTVKWYGTDIIKSMRENKNLDVLKWAHKYNFIDSDIILPNRFK